MSFPRRISLTAIAIFLLALSCLPASAGAAGNGVRHSAYPPENILQELISGSERVFVGHCIGLEEEQVPGAGASIVTVTFDVEANLLGGDSKEISFSFYSRSPGKLTTPRPGTQAGPEEIAAYGVIEPASEPSVGDNTGRIERLNSTARHPKPGIVGHDRAPVRFRVGEEVLLFLPALSETGFLRSNDPGFAKMTIAEIGPDGARAAIASAGPHRLTALPFSPGKHGRLEELIERIETHLSGRQQPASAAGGIR